VNAVKLPDRLLLDLYRTMLRIRLVQLRIEHLYHLDEMKTPVHLCIGQEAVAAGVCACLECADYISSNHRGHGHYLAKGGNLKSLIAELYCRATGCSRGHGGSMHLVDVSVGHLGSSAIVGGGIPIATGLALAVRMRGEPPTKAVFFCDGAADEAGQHDSVNCAILKRLPIVYVYENNQFSVCSRVSARQPGHALFHAAPKTFLSTACVDGNAVVEVYAAAKAAVDHARSGQGPAFIECKTYRMRGHAGAGSDVALGYRDQHELALWARRCPLRNFEKQLTASGVLTEAGRAAIEAEIEREIDEAFRFAQDSPLPNGKDALQHVCKD